MKYLSAAGCLIVVAAQLVVAQSKSDQPSCSQHEEHMRQQHAKPAKAAEHDHSSMSGDKRFHEMNSRAEEKQGMNFTQSATVHYFSPTPTGGVIMVNVKQASDTQETSRVREHLRAVTRDFAVGNFSKPMFVHGEKPAGIDEMARLKSEIQYRFEETPQGGQVLIETHNAEALKAIHAFIGYQVREHRTNDDEGSQR